MSDSTPPKPQGRPRGSGSLAWRAFFQQSTTPVFVLGKGRRLRFANSAWEKLTGLPLADALGMVCSGRRGSSPLAAALAPTPEVESGKPDRVRRVAPKGRHGPPWWDISFTPLAAADGLLGIVGSISVVGDNVPQTLRKLPPFVATLREQHAAGFSFDLFAGHSTALERFCGQLRYAASSTAPVWLVGEAGSGKETSARVIHHNGPQRNKAFLGISCQGLQPFMIESLLFGHGGLIGSGHVGTIYLKEPAALPRDLQCKLAELFTEAQTGTPRLISGSSTPAANDVAAGKLIPDFHTELAVLELRVPSLRSRLDDLPRLAAQLVPQATIDPTVFEVLRVQSWKGNLRELAETLQQASAAAGGTVTLEHLPLEMRLKAGSDPVPVHSKPLALDSLLEAVERRLIALAMTRSQGNTTKAAELLGIFRTRLGRRLEALGQGE